MSKENSTNDKPSDPADRNAGLDQFKSEVVIRRAGYGKVYERAYYWAKKGATLQAGEGAALVAKIDELESYVKELESIIEMYRGNDG